jgi:2-polyprenyl-3-methyl-5-hydroxy-6-metoxy-1,4-benzoquinol methylase
MTTRCQICDEETEVSFQEKVLQKHNAIFDYCQSCGFLRARNPHWLAGAYSSAIASTDTGLVARNYTIGRKLASVLFGVLRERGQGRYADIAGGYGMLTRIMRDYGFDFYWSDKYCDNLMARGFEYLPEIGPCHAITAIEIMEHLEDPLTFIREALELTKASTFIFTTELFNGPPPDPGQWWYYSFETGQHIAFFQRRTLELMALKLGLSFESCGGVHVFSNYQTNKTRLRLFTGRISIIYSWWVRRTLGTKVMSDHLKLVERLRDSQ